MSRVIQWLREMLYPIIYPKQGPLRRVLANQNNPKPHDHGRVQRNHYRMLKVHSNIKEVLREI